MSLAVLLTYLETHPLERNSHDAYDLTLAQDLLGDGVAAVHKERCGQVASASRTHVVDSMAACQCLVQRLLHRRLSTPQQIRCAYRYCTGRLSGRGC